MLNDRLKALITHDNAVNCIESDDPLCFCADISGLRIDDPRVEEIESALEQYIDHLDAQFQIIAEAMCNR